MRWITKESTIRASVQAKNRPCFFRNKGMEQRGDRGAKISVRIEIIAQHFLLKGSVHPSHSLCSVFTCFLGLKSLSLPDVGALKQEIGVSGCAKACCLTRQGSQSMAFIWASQGQKEQCKCSGLRALQAEDSECRDPNQHQGGDFKDLAPDQSHLYKQGARKDSRVYWSSMHCSPLNWNSELV